MPVRPRPKPNPETQPRPRDESPDGSVRPNAENSLPVLNDKQKLEKFRNQVRNYPGWDATRRQRAVSNTFDRLVSNNDDYLATVNDAASQNKPVVMLIGSSSDPATRHLIENSLREARSQNGRDALYAFVDLDKIDKNSAIGRYALENMPKKGQEPPFTMVFGLSRGDAANPVKADAPSFYTMGPADARSINESVSRLRLQMSGRFQGTDLPPQTNTSPEKPLNPQAPDPRLQEAIAMALVQAQRQPDKESAYKLYKQAVDIADSGRNPQLQAAARVELGLACINWGHKETGFKWILEAGAKNPELYKEDKNQPYKERLKDAGLSQAGINMLIERGKEDPLWHQKDKEAVKKLEATMSPTAPLPTNPELPRPITPATSPSPHLRPSPFRRQ